VKGEIIMDKEINEFLKKRICLQN